MKEHHQLHHHPNTAITGTNHYNYHHHHPRGNIPLVVLIGLWVCLFEFVKLIWIYSHLQGGGSQELSKLSLIPPLGVFSADDDKLEELTSWNQVAVAIGPVQLQDDSTAKVVDEWETKKQAILQTATKRNVVLRKGHTAKHDICETQMNLIYQRQYCLQQASRGEFSQCLQILRQTNEEESSANSPILVPGPVHQLSYMWGQGFGRIITQGVRTCNLAALLNRPCSIDIFRDKFYNFRAFLRPGELNWEAASRIVMAQNSVNISDALHKMPKGIEKGHGWEDLDKVPDYDNVLPMVWGNDKKITAENIERHIDYWHAQNPDHGHQVLLSPNFGDAWYAYGHDYIRLQDSWNKRNRPCSINHMKTRMQNEMFVPTSLSYELHLERRALVLREPELQNGPNSKVLTTSSGLSARDSLPPYGAIHLRMKILNQDMYKMGVSNEQVLGGLKSCLDGFSQFRGLRWWLISDDAAVAEYISEHLDNVYSYDDSLKVPVDNSSGSATLRPQGIHSGDAIGRKFGQEALAPSMIDWMGLHESQIALVTWDTAYGETGARGNGKVQEGTCGGIIRGGKNGKLKFPMFNVYK